MSKKGTSYADHMRWRHMSPSYQEAMKKAEELRLKPVRNPYEEPKDDWAERMADEHDKVKRLNDGE